MFGVVPAHEALVVPRIILWCLVSLMVRSMMYVVIQQVHHKQEHCVMERVILTSLVWSNRNGGGSSFTISERC